VVLPISKELKGVFKELKVVCGFSTVWGVSTPNLCVLFKGQLILYSGNEHLSKWIVNYRSYGSHCLSGRLQKGKSGEG